MRTMLPTRIQKYYANGTRVLRTIRFLEMVALIVDKPQEGFLGPPGDSKQIGGFLTRVPDVELPPLVLLDNRVRANIADK